MQSVGPQVEPGFYERMVKHKKSFVNPSMFNVVEVLSLSIFSRILMVVVVLGHQEGRSHAFRQKVFSYGNSLLCSILSLTFSSGYASL